MDYYLVKKSITNYCFVKHVGKRLKDNLQKEGIKFETEKYIYQEIIKEINSPDLEQ